jgi:hypothetical protein
MTAKSLTARGLRRSLTRLTGRTLRVVLVLSLWHAPIPWVHAHEIDGPDVDHLQVLSRHVAEFHSRELNQGEKTLDWHMHLVLPWCLVHHLPCPDQQQGEPNSDDYVGGARCSAVASNVVKTVIQPASRAFRAEDLATSDGIWLASAAGVNTAISAIARGQHFFETYGRTHSVRDLVGVRLC